ncbi:MAG: molecular chaperone GroES [Sulfurovum sp. AS07-7]|jgi:chaperonin GroES|nr:MAG: molecular chaperone GroES [Sulfurovum sp. AS07-7]TQV62776.1 MAG: co-chaperone GroES [Sulfurovum sp.]
MAFQPLGNRVLIERQEQTNRTSTGIIIPDSAKEKPLQGKVVAVSTESSEAGLSIGDVVVFAKYKGTEITIDYTTYLIMDSEDILGIMK